MAKHPQDYARQTPGDGRRFHIRRHIGGVWQVYSRGLEHLCDCVNSDTAEMIADALEQCAEEHAPEPLAKGITPEDTEDTEITEEK